MKLLKQSGVLVTNPPFSLFRELYELIIQNGKDFILLETLQVMTYKTLFKDKKESKAFVGGSQKKVEFLNPLGGLESFGNIMWYTSLEGGAVHRELELEKSYYGDENFCEKYDDTDVINVDRVKDIPKDYYGVMGVPISFLKYMYGSDFEIVELGECNISGLTCPYIEGKKKYKRLLIQRKKKDE